MQQPYPGHLYDPKRRDIAVRYLQHELRKLFPHLRDEEIWKQLDTEAANWWEGNPTLAPVRDFWNGFHAISMGFKLKNLVSWLTSVNITWEEKELSVDDLYFGSSLGPLKQLEQNPSGKQVKEWLFAKEQTTILETEQRKDAEESGKTMLRNHFPIIAMRKQEKLIVTDGNRRLLHAILTNKPTISAVIGEPIAEPVLFETWVPTSTLLELVFWHRQWSEQGKEITQSVAQVITELIRDSSAGQTELIERCPHLSSKTDRRLLAEI